MSYFAAVLARSGDTWRGVEVSLEECESIDDFADVARDEPGALRLLLIEQDDEFAAIVRVDDDEDPRAFLSDGHAADEYSLAAIFADELAEIGLGTQDQDEEDEADDEELEQDDVSEEVLLAGTPPVHDSAPFGDADILEDLGTAAADLLALCAHEGTLPIDVLATVCEKAGCGDAFDDLRA